MSPPLILFVVLLWTSSAFCLDQDDALKAEGPPITLVSMKTNFVVISWKKTDEWTNVTDFTVTITKETLDSEPLCIKKVICEKEDPCTFDSGRSGCPDLGPCTTFEILVEGNGTSSSLQNLISVPYPPSNVTMEEQDSTSIKVTWVPTLFSSWCPLESSYVTWSLENGTEFQSEDIDTEEGNNYTITDLIPCSTHKVEVTSKNSEGYGQPSDPVYLNTSLTVPKAPRAVTCVNAGTQNVNVTWNKPPNNNCAKEYFVNYTGDVLWSEEVQTDSRRTPLEFIDLEGLTPWTSYTVCIAGAVEDGSLGSFNCCSIETSQGAPSAPASFRANASSNSVTLTWERPVELNGMLIGYLLSWGSQNKTLPNDTTEYTQDISPKTDYHFIIKAMTEGGIGEGISVDVTAKKTSNVLGIVLGVLGGLVVVVALAAVAFIYRQKIINFKTKMTQSRTQNMSEENIMELSPNGSSASPTTSYPPPGKVSAPEGIPKQDLRQYHTYENVKGFY